MKQKFYGMGPRPPTSTTVIPKAGAGFEPVWVWGTTTYTWDFSGQVGFNFALGLVTHFLVQWSTNLVLRRYLTELSEAS